MNMKLNNRRTVFAWCMYDFANSAFTTLVITFIYSTYFTQVMAENVIIGTRLWSQGITISAITVAFLSPILGAIADRSHRRKLFLFLMTSLAIIGTIFLYDAVPGQTTQALFWFIIANIGFEAGMVFYNAYLPEIAPSDKIGRISGYGWSLGYVGGLVVLVIALVGFVQPDEPWFGFSKEAGENIRATNLLVAVWFAVFSLPAFLWIKENKTSVKNGDGNLIHSALQQIWQTLQEMKRYRQTLKFLLARIFYNDGLITIFAFGGIYAAGILGFTMPEILIFGIVLNITAGIGAFTLGFLDDKIGGKKTIQISIIGLILATILAVIATDKSTFWLAGIMIGIFSGPNQAASRSLLSRMVPYKKENEFFGFFAFSGKATAFAGPLALGILTETFHSQRVGVTVIIFLFIIGAFIMSRVDEKEGIKAAERG